MKVITFLPVFGGFYGTIWDPFEGINEDMLLEDIVEYLHELEIDPDKYDLDLLADYVLDEVDVETYKVDVCRYLAYANEYDLRQMSLIGNMHYSGIESPRTYNFANDICTVEVDFDSGHVDRMKEYLHENWGSFCKYIMERYTSGPGFMSFYSNDPAEFISGEWWEDEHKLGSVLRFVIMNEYDEHPEYEYYEYSEVRINSYIDLSVMLPELVRNRERYEVPAPPQTITEIDNIALICMLREARKNSKVVVRLPGGTARIKDVVYTGTENHSTVYIEV